MDDTLAPAEIAAANEAGFTAGDTLWARRGSRTAEVKLRKATGNPNGYTVVLPDGTEVPNLRTAHKRLLDVYTPREWHKGKLPAAEAEAAARIAAMRSPEARAARYEDEAAAMAERARARAEAREAKARAKAEAAASATPRRRRLTAAQQRMVEEMAIERVRPHGTDDFECATCGAVFTTPDECLAHLDTDHPRVIDDDHGVVLDAVGAVA